MATIKKTQFKVEITTFGGYTATADDGQNPGVGVAANGALYAHDDIVIANEAKTIFIPFHAVDHAEITKTQVEEEEPVDNNCREE